MASQAQLLNKGFTQAQIDAAKQWVASADSFEAGKGIKKTDMINIVINALLAVDPLSVALALDGENAHNSWLAGLYNPTTYNFGVGTHTLHTRGWRIAMLFITGSQGGQGEPSRYQYRNNYRNRIISNQGEFGGVSSFGNYVTIDGGAGGAGGAGGVDDSAGVPGDLGNFGTIIATNPLAILAHNQNLAIVKISHSSITVVCGAGGLGGLGGLGGRWEYSSQPRASSGAAASIQVWRVL